MPNGFTGNILHANLTTGELTVEHPPESFYRKYLGGSAMGLHYILEGLKPGADALGPDNIFTLMLSPHHRRRHLRPEPRHGQRQVAAGGRHRRQPDGRLLPGRDEVRRLRRRGGHRPRREARLPVAARRRGRRSAHGRAARRRRTCGATPPRKWTTLLQAPSWATTRSRSPSAARRARSCRGWRPSSTWPTAPPAAPAWAPSWAARTSRPWPPAARQAPARGR